MAAITASCLPFRRQKAEAIFDITCYFCENYLRRGDRTIGQMIQAARSGKQNIAEGSAASSTSKEMEIKLVNVRPPETIANMAIDGSRPQSIVATPSQQ